MPWHAWMSTYWICPLCLHASSSVLVRRHEGRGSVEGQVIDSFIDLDVAATSRGGFSGFTLCFLVKSQLRSVRWLIYSTFNKNLPVLSGSFSTRLKLTRLGVALSNQNISLDISSQTVTDLRVSCGFKHSVVLPLHSAALNSRSVCSAQKM